MIKAAIDCQNDCQWLSKLLTVQLQVTVRAASNATADGSGSAAATSKKQFVHRGKTSYTMENLMHLSLRLWCFFHWFWLGVKSSNGGHIGNKISEKKMLIHVGVVLVLESPIGSVANACISMAISDFYATHSNYSSRLFLHTRNSVDVVGAALATLDLINNDEVNAIMGPQKSMQAKFVIGVGGKAQVPVISFSAGSPSLSTTQNPFFIRTAHNDNSQVQAITSIVKAYGWHQVVLVYEDTEYGGGLLPYLSDAFQQFDIRITYRCSISRTSSGFRILEKLNKLMAQQTRVFLVHITHSLGSRLFLLAKQAGMMSEGYAWIITYGLASLLDSMGSEVTDSMKGVLGIRPYIPKLKRLENFKKKWKSEFDSNATELNIFGLWAYDTVWALAMAVEMVGKESPNAFKRNSSRNKSQVSGIRVSEIGPRLQNDMLNVRFKGLSGNFHLVKGELQSSAFEIINVVGKEGIVIGYWTPEKGLSGKLGYSGDVVEYSTSLDELKPPIWPGDSKTIPKGWAIPVEGKKLMTGVPVKLGFDEYLKVELHPYTNEPIVSGFSYDVFLAALEALPFAVKHKPIPFIINGSATYDDLLHQIKVQKFDPAVGDITILADRSVNVDFTLPYLQSHVSMPLSWDLWLTNGATFTFTGLVVWILEHRINTEFRGPPEQQLGTIFWFSFSILVFAHREKVMNNLSRFVLIIWIFVVLILTQSYTASLASMLAVQRLQPAVVDIKELKKNGDYVGYEAGSFVKDLLVNKLQFDESRLKPYSTPEEFDEALSKGSKRGGVDAIFGAQHCIELFLAKFCDKYMTAGPNFKTDGLGFAFPRGSPLVPYMSRAILNVTENKTAMEALENKYFKQNVACQECQSQRIASDSLSVYSFGGLFIITVIASLSALLIYMSKFLYSHWPELGTFHAKRSTWSKLTELARLFDRKVVASNPFERNESRAHHLVNPQGVEAPYDFHSSQNSSMTSEGVEMVVRNDGNPFFREW
ncbi:glutamate receptor 2.7-like [Durio zibethinus]|uniref:Glutamate receptor n=1 Tax=Durio zibethinus TaxID=66656 RepID=A0A6P5XK80_DURZI|nr:glutamate receptor 2.7-like [Durio zibethinus]